MALRKNFILRSPRSGRLEGRTTLILPVGEIIDLGREKARLAKEISRLDADLVKFAGKLANPAFLAKAKTEVIDEQREREADARRDRERLQAVYDRIAAG